MKEKIKEFFERFHELLKEYDVSVGADNSLDEPATFYLYFFHEPTEYYRFKERDWNTLKDEEITEEKHGKSYKFNEEGELVNV